MCSFNGIFTLLIAITLATRTTVTVTAADISTHNNINTNTHADMPEKRIAPVISALKDFEQQLPGYLNANKTVAILLDYDGTLVPITDNPNKTEMPVELEVVLNRLAQHPKVFMAIISGRGLKDVQRKVAIKGITYSGNHGMEIENPDGTRQDYELPKNVQASYRQMVNELNERVAKNKAWVEDKGYSVTYHYRDIITDAAEQQKQLAFEIIEKYGFKANQAHEAVEAKPPVNRNKGEAAALILNNKFGSNWAEQINVIFAGDDTTDEDAMRALQGRGKSFRVSDNPDIQTFADFRLPEQAVVTDLLKWIASVYTS